MVTLAGSFTHNLLFPPAGSSPVLDLWFVFTWSDLWVVAWRLSHGHKDIATLSSSWVQQEMPTSGLSLWVSPPLVWKIMSQIVRSATPHLKPQAEKWLCRHICFGTSLWVIAAERACEKRMWVKVQLVIKENVVAWVAISTSESSFSQRSAYFLSVHIAYYNNPYTILLPLFDFIMSFSETTVS